MLTGVFRLINQNGFIKMGCHLFTPQIVFKHPAHHGTSSFWLLTFTQY